MTKTAKNLYLKTLITSAVVVINSLAIRTVSNSASLKIWCTEAWLKTLRDIERCSSGRKQPAIMQSLLHITYSRRTFCTRGSVFRSSLTTTKRLISPSTTTALFSPSSTTFTVWSTNRRQTVASFASLKFSNFDKSSSTRLRNLKCTYQISSNSLSSRQFSKYKDWLCSSWYSRSKTIAMRSRACFTNQLTMIQKSSKSRQSKNKSSVLPFYLNITPRIQKRI